MNWPRTWTVIQKDWFELFNNKMAFLPMLVLPVLFVVVMPAFMIGGLLASWEAASAELADIMHNFPQTMLPAGLDLRQQALYVVSVFFLAPFFLIIPVMTASVIAGNSLVGEKERKTIEGLLYTPITDQELIMAKVLSALLPAVGLTWISFVVYAVLVNAMGYTTMKYIFFPTASWWALILIVVPVISFIAIALMVRVSERAKSFMEAQQYSGFLVMPIVLLVVSQSSGLFYLSLPVILGVGAGLIVLAFLLFQWNVRHVNRERLVSRYI